MGVKPIELKQGTNGRLAQLEAAFSGANARLLEFIVNQAGDTIHAGGNEKTLKSTLALADYLRTDAGLAASIVDMTNSDAPVFVIDTPHWSLEGNTPRELYRFIDQAGADAGSIKAGMAGLKDNADAVLAALGNYPATVIFYEIQPLPSRTSITRVYDVRPRAVGAHAERINATFRNVNLGLVVKTTDAEYSQAEASAYAAIAEDQRIHSAATLISSLGATSAMTRITHSRLADQEINSPDLQYALKHAHLRQVALVQQAVERSPPQGQRKEPVGPKLYDAIAGVIQMGMEDQIELLMASLAIDGLLDEGGYAARVDPTAYQTWLDLGTGGIEGLVAKASQPNEREAFNAAASSLCISDFKRTLDLYPEFNDAIEASLTADATSVGAIIRGCRAFSAMRQFYSGKHTRDEESDFHAALLKWDKSPTAEAQAALAPYGVSLAMPDADMARICAMTAIRLLRWNHTTSQLKDMSTADATMTGKETRPYITTAIEALQLAKGYAAKESPLANAFGTAIKYAQRLNAKPVASV